MPQELFIENMQGEKLAGTLYGTLGKKLVIICHGLAASQHTEFLVAIAKKLEEKQLPSFCFNFSGYPPSEGDFTESTFHKQPQDLQSVVEYFLEQGVEEICLLGHSMGGAAIKVVAQNNEHIKALVALAGVSKAERFPEKYPTETKAVQEQGVAYLFQENHGEKYPITQEYIDSALTIDLMQTAPHIHCPVLCVQGDKDTPGRDKETREWLQRLPQDTQSMFVILPDVDHVFNKYRGEELQQKGYGLLLDTVLPWIEKNF